MHTPAHPPRTSTWKTLFEGGAAASDNPIERRAVLVKKLAIVMALLANVSIMASFFVIGDTVPTRALLLMTISSVLYVACFLLLHQGRATTSSVTFSVSLLTTAFFLTLSLGTNVSPTFCACRLPWWHHRSPACTGHDAPRTGLHGAVLRFDVSTTMSVANLTLADDTAELMAQFYAVNTVVLCGSILLLNNHPRSGCRTSSIPSAPRSKTCCCRSCPCRWPASCFRPVATPLAGWAM